MKTAITLLLLGLAEIVLAAYSWRYCSEILRYPTASARIVEQKAALVDNKPFLLLRYEFIADGHRHEGAYMEKLGSTDSPDLYVSRHYGRDGRPTVRYDPLDPRENTLRVPNTWHAVIGMCAGIYCIGLFVWALVNTTVFKCEERGILGKANAGPATVPKYLLAGIAVVLLVVSFFGSALYTTEIGTTIMLSDGFFILAPFAAVVVYTAAIISQLPLFCCLSQSETCNRYWDQAVRIVRSWLQVTRGL
jgi:hypothetical protein